MTGGTKGWQKAEQGGSRLLRIPERLARPSKPMYQSSDMGQMCRTVVTGGCQLAVQRELAGARRVVMTHSPTVNLRVVGGILADDHNLASIF